jgi:WD40 repeat protein
MKAKIFISYSRRNKAFTQRLFDALVERGYDPWVDWDDIPFSVDWWQEIQEAINENDVMINVVSYHSLTSRVVNQEIKYARDNNKRIIPLIAEKVNIREVVGELYDQPYEMDARANWKYLRTLNWIYFYRDEDNFEKGIENIIDAIEIDYPYLREHTRLLNRAQEWNDNKRGAGFLLMGEELADAEQWLSRAEDENRTPLPTNLHIEFITTSREYEAEQQAQYDAIRRQTRRLRGATIGLIIAGTLTVTVVGFFLYQSLRINRELFMAREASLLQSTQVRQTQVQESTRAVETQQSLLAAGTESASTQQAILADVKLQRERADALRLASEAENVLEDGDPNRFALPLAIAAHRVVTGGTPPVRVSRILGEAAYQPGLERFLAPPDSDTAHRLPVAEMAFSPDGTQIASASQDRTIRLWDVQTGNPLATLTGHSGRVLTVAFSSDGTRLVSGDSDNAVILWDAATGTRLQVFNGHEDRVTDVAFSPDGTQVVSTSADTNVRVWNIETGENIRILQLHGTRVTQLAYHPDGTTFVTGDAGGQIIVWNAAQGNFLRREDRHAGAITSMAFSRDGSRLLTTSLNGRFILWEDLQTGARQVNDQLLGREALTGGGFIRDDTAVFSTDAGQLIVWNLRALPDESGEIRRLNVPGTPSPVTTLTLGPNQRLAGVAYDDRRLGLWELENGDVVQRQKVQNVPITGLTLTSDEQLVYRYFNGAIVQTDADGTVTVFNETDLGVSGGALFPDGGTLLARDLETDARVRVDLNSGEVLATYPLGINPTTTVFSPDGRLAVSRTTSLGPDVAGQRGGSHVVWDTETGEDVITLSATNYLLSNDPASFAFNPAGSLLAAVSGELTLLVFDLETGTVAHQYDRSRVITSVGFAGDDLLIAGYIDGGLAAQQLSGASTVTDWRDLRAHATAVNTLVASRDGAYLLSGSDDGEAVIWQTDTLEIKRRMQTDTTSVTGGVFNGATTQFATRSSDGSVVLWRLEDDAVLIDWALQNRLIVQLTPQDCAAFQVPDPCNGPTTVTARR